MTGTGETNAYVLADRMNRLPSEVRAMPALDYVGLCNYYEVKDVMTKLQHDTAAAKGR